MASVRFASTVVLVRADGGKGFEILLTRRPRQMRFLGGCYVFPGGTVRPEDCSDRLMRRCRGLSRDDACEILRNCKDMGLSLGHWVAGIRELFEEVGVLLCAGEAGGVVNLKEEVTRERLERKRKSLVEESLGFEAFLESEGLVCDLSRAVYFYHRITPEVYPIRFDTRFYLALLPLGQDALPRSEEVAESLWIKPGEALCNAREDGFPLLPPTTTVLEDLARVRSWEELLARYGLR